MGTKRPGAGRPKGALNKENRQLREMILEALDMKGGSTYLAKQADEHPGPFMSLLGKVLPLQLTGEGGGAIVIQATSKDENL